MKIIFQKIVFFLMVIIISGGVITLLIAANKIQEKELCQGLIISIVSKHDNLFIDQKDIESFLFKKMGKSVKGEKTTALKLHQLELLLEKNSWIENAEMWMDGQRMLHIKILEREPIARIFTEAGNSFYIDSSMKIIPLSDKMNVRVPVFIGVSESVMVAPSKQMKDIKVMSTFLLKDSFWNSQVSQIEIVPNENFEIIPAIGNHIIQFGACENIENKFKKLYTLYKQILTVTGFDTYKIINVQYTNQVIGIKSSQKNMIIDSIQVQQKIEEIMHNVNIDTVAVVHKTVAHNSKNNNSINNNN
ncbi:MAG: hypothetical protein EPO57_03455 [Chitinophagaceae bacterium]|nr:MAG: hypothetical protein EPO57_03455 [Chitinophagaceae bacterium]